MSNHLAFSVVVIYESEYGNCYVDTSRFPDMSESESGRRIQSVLKAFTIIERLSEQGNAGPAELSRSLDISRGTVHAYLRTLEELGLLIQTADGYRLGLEHLRYGGYVRDALYRDVFTTAKPEIDGLAEKTGEKAQITVVENAKSYILYQAHSDRAVRTDSHTGTDLPLHGTASGKVYLSRLDEDALKSTLSTIEMEGMTDRTITDRDELLTEIERIRSEGIAIDNGERVDGIRCLAAPVETDEGEPIGAISVSLPEYRWNDVDIESELRPVVENTARVIGLNITYM
jgi:DNA-binding IclR family transcriptional regulator